MAADEDKEDKQDQGEAKPKGKKKLIIIVAVVLVLLLGGGIGFVSLSGKSSTGEQVEGEEHEEEKHYETITLEPIIVNLSESTSFLKIRLVLEYDPEILFSGGSGTGGGHGYGGGASGGEEGGGDLPPVFATREPMIKDAIIRVVSSKTAADVLSVAGKETLKEELLEAINEALGLDESPIVNIYFLDFIIQ